MDKLQVAVLLCSWICVYYFVYVSVSCVCGLVYNWCKSRSKRDQ